MEEMKQKRPRRRRSKQRGIRWGRLIVLIAILGLLIGGIGYGIASVVHWIQGPAQTQPAETAGTSFENKDPRPTNPLPNLNDTAPLYVLVVGRDDSKPPEADSLFLMGLNPLNKRVDIIGIPSHTKIEARDKKSMDPISSVYAKGGIELTTAVIEDLFGIKIPYYVMLDKSSFYTMLAMTGTPDMYVEKTMEHTDATTGKQDIQLARGTQTMNPDKAYQYMRYIDSDKNSFERTQRQERFMKQVFSKEIEAPTFSKLWLIWRVWGYFDTNMSTKDAMYLIWSLRDVTMQQVHFYTLPGTNVQIDNTLYWAMDPTGAQRLVGVMLGNVEESELNAPVTPEPKKQDDTKKEDDKADKAPTNGI